MTEQRHIKHKRGPRGGMTPRLHHFGTLIASGESQANAYRIAYKKPKLLPPDCASRASKLARDARVIALIEQLRGKAIIKKMLTLNDRLKIVGEIAQDKTAAKSDRIRAVDVYNKMAPDTPPERQEISGPGGGPIEVSTQVSGAIAITTLSTRQRAAALRDARKRRQAEDDAGVEVQK